MEPSIFTKIIKGEIPCHKVYEDDKVIALMDIHPIQTGQILVVPKVQIENFEDLKTDDYQAVWEVVQKAAKTLRQVFPDKLKIAVHVEGLDVPHVHVKVFPFDTDAEFHNHPDLSAEPDHEALAELAKRLYFK